MPEGILCNKKTVDTEEQLHALLADKSGKQYYEEMKALDVDSDALWATIQKTLKSRLKTWLEICAHCGMCAESCFFYLANKKDPEQVPSYKIQSTLGELVRRKGKVDNAFMQPCHGYGLVQVHLLQPVRHVLPLSASTWGSCSATCAVCATLRDSSPGN
jgi:ferredoxin